jgi:clan AA aspartic protease
MGVAQVTVTVRNPADTDRLWEGLFLVDTGAVDCLVPRKHLRELGIKPAGMGTYELADGTEVAFEVGGAQVEFMGDTVWATVTFGDDDAEPILGVTSLQSFGIEVDPRSQRLTRLPAVRLKSLRPGESDAT